jgi:processive 1,2-diacylglycerol beta-glucosyltransferase
MAEKVLIVSLRAGAGHLMAAAALEAACLDSKPALAVRNIDLLDYSTDLIKLLYGKMYLDLVKLLPELYAYSYKHYEPSKKFIKPRFLIDRFSFSAFFELMEDFDPDVLVCTHFIPTALVENYRRKRRKRFSIAVTLTDYEFHPLWIAPNIDLYFTATQEVKSSLMYYGVEPEKIVVSGIPVHPRFSQPKDRESLLRKHDLREGSPIILISAGSFGITPLEEVMDELGGIKEEFQLMVVCGKNADLEKELLEKQKTQPRLRKVFGFVDFMDELMVMSNLLITKPGGITVSESLAVGLPMILIEPIPGQEEANADYVVEQGAAVRARSVSSLIYKLELLIGDSEKLKGMSRRASEISHPDAARIVVEGVKSGLTHRGVPS